MRIMIPQRHRGVGLAAALVLAIGLAPAVPTGAAGATETTSRKVAQVSASTINLERSANFGRNVSGLKPAAAVDALALGPALVIQLPRDRDGKSGVDASGVVLNGPTADGQFSQVVAGSNSAGGGFGFVTEQHGMVQERLPVSMMPGTTLRSLPGGGLEQVTASGAVVGGINAAYAVDEVGNRLPASYAFDASTSSIVVSADTRLAHGATFIDPSWNCIMAVKSLVGWANVGLAAWIVTALATGGWSAVVGFLVWQGYAAWKTYNVIQACR